uniref:Uncharacterized protein n=1 Tax=Lotharella globosa TaxID=91324 RepID=A0A7S3Z703_9EUKA
MVSTCMPTYWLVLSESLVKGRGQYETEKKKTPQKHQKNPPLPGGSIAPAHTHRFDARTHAYEYIHTCMHTHAHRSTLCMCGEVYKNKQKINKRITKKQQSEDRMAPTLLTKQAV